MLGLPRVLELAWAAVFVLGAGAVRVGVAVAPVLAAIGATTLVIAVIATVQHTWITRPLAFATPRSADVRPRH